MKIDLLLFFNFADDGISYEYIIENHMLLLMMMMMNSVFCFFYMKIMIYKVYYVCNWMSF